MNSKGCILKEVKKSPANSMPGGDEPRESAVLRYRTIMPCFIPLMAERDPMLSDDASVFVRPVDFIPNARLKRLLGI